MVLEGVVGSTPVGSTMQSSTYKLIRSLLAYKKLIRSLSEAYKKLIVLSRLFSRAFKLLLGCFSGSFKVLLRCFKGALQCSEGALLSCELLDPSECENDLEDLDGGKVW